MVENVLVCQISESLHADSEAAMFMLLSPHHAFISQLPLKSHSGAQVSKGERRGYSLTNTTHTHAPSNTRRVNVR